MWRSAPPYGRCFNVLAAGRIRNEAGVPTMVAGGVTDRDDVRTALLSGRADYMRLDAAPEPARVRIGVGLPAAIATPSRA